MADPAEPEDEQPSVIERGFIWAEQGIFATAGIALAIGTVVVHVEEGA
jgi:hypothetical protein